MKKLFLIVVFLVNIALHAQVRNMFDTIKYDFTKRGKFFVGLDGKNNIVGDLKVKMFGVQCGYLFNNRTSLYLGFYNTYGNNSYIVENNTAPQGKVDSNTVYATYGMGYFNFGIEYMFHNSRKWRLSVPIATGLGAGKYIRQSKSTLYENRYPGIVPIEFSINASYKLKWWLWVGGGLGTRISLSHSHEFNGPFYTFGLQIKTGTIIRKAREAYKEYQEMR
ncbi:MAG: hypothetical protein PSX81_10830 [bacterium]|nr:hypothetical protein [bacterium]